MTRLFGLTGGMASGKSTVAERLRELGIVVVDADVLAREVVAKGTPGLDEVVRRFGRDVLTSSGDLDRKRLAAHVFSNSDTLATLNAIVHPRVKERLDLRLEKLSQRGEPLACYEVPLLFENGLEKGLRPVVLVAAPEEQQIQRAMARDGSSRDHVLSRLGAQMPLTEKLLLADYVIHNDADRATLLERTDAVARELEQRFAN